MSTDSKIDEIKSPCVRNCCLDENDICLGCFRSIDEIVGWSASSRKEKEIILSNCQERHALLKS